MRDRDMSQMAGRQTCVHVPVVQLYPLGLRSSPSPRAMKTPLASVKSCSSACSVADSGTLLIQSTPSNWLPAETQSLKDNKR